MTHQSIQHHHSRRAGFQVSLRHPYVCLDDGGVRTCGAHRLTKRIKSSDKAENGSSRTKRSKHAAASPFPRQHSKGPPPVPQDASDAVRRKVSSSISTALQLPIGDDSGLQKYPAEEVAKEVEAAMYAHHKGAGKDYRTKFRSLHFNLKDPSNVELRLRVLTKQITPQQLCLMVRAPAAPALGTSLIKSGAARSRRWTLAAAPYALRSAAEAVLLVVAHLSSFETADVCVVGHLQGPAELANPNLAQWRSAKEEELMYHRTLVTEDDGEKRVRKTHKGEEVVEGDDHQYQDSQQATRSGATGLAEPMDTAAAPEARARAADSARQVVASPPPPSPSGATPLRPPSPSHSPSPSTAVTAASKTSVSSLFSGVTTTVISSNNAANLAAARKQQQQQEEEDYDPLAVEMAAAQESDAVQPTEKKRGWAYRGGASDGSAPAAPAAVREWRGKVRP